MADYIFRKATDADMPVIMVSVVDCCAKAAIEINIETNVSKIFLINL